MVKVHSSEDNYGKTVCLNFKMKNFHKVEPPHPFSFFFLLFLLFDVELSPSTKVVGRSTWSVHSNSIFLQKSVEIISSLLAWKVWDEYF